MGQEKPTLAGREVVREASYLGSWVCICSPCKEEYAEALLCLPHSSWKERFEASGGQQSAFRWTGAGWGGPDESSRGLWKREPWHPSARTGRSRGGLATPAAAQDPHVRGEEGGSTGRAPPAAGGRRAGRGSEGMRLLRAGQRHGSWHRAAGDRGRPGGPREGRELPRDPGPGRP